MGDDSCRPHKHFDRGDRPECSRHHYFPRDGSWFCMGCSTVRESVVSRDVGRKYQDRIEP